MLQQSFLKDFCPVYPSFCSMTWVWKDTLNKALFLGAGIGGYTLRRPQISHDSEKTPSLNSIQSLSLDLHSHIFHARFSKYGCGSS